MLQASVFLLLQEAPNTKAMSKLRPSTAQTAQNSSLVHCFILLYAYVQYLLTIPMYSLYLLEQDTQVVVSTYLLQPLSLGSRFRSSDEPSVSRVNRGRGGKKNKNRVTLLCFVSTCFRPQRTNNASKIKSNRSCWFIRVRKIWFFL